MADGLGLACSEQSEAPRPGFPQTFLVELFRHPKKGPFGPGSRDFCFFGDTHSASGMVRLSALAERTSFLHRFAGGKRFFLVKVFAPEAEKASSTISNADHYTIEAKYPASVIYSTFP